MQGLLVILEQKSVWRVIKTAEKITGSPLPENATGSSKHKIEISSEREDSEPTLQDMAAVIAQVTGVPQQSQKLIFKGKSLKEMEEPLSVLGVKNGCKIMMIGKKNSPEEEAELKKLKDLEKSIQQLSHKLEEINVELTGIQNGFLACDLRSTALSKLEKKMKSISEQYMRFLEQIDAMSLPDDFNDCRHRRKGLVKNIQEKVSAIVAAE
ncbi:BAG family molecular chaperone regulator 1 isoform X2 [Narcine bancroftii]|uniref:BAG family molecular chaperone regulator 1 isoform X2 n=1 Tax=Narcine bancroftii TaxID=1343680 RepID=UPI00383155B8